MKRLLKRAVWMAKAGRIPQARNLLIFIVNHDWQNAEAWKWLAAVASSEHEVRLFAESVLALDPTDSWARGLLDGPDVSLEPPWSIPNNTNSG